MTEPAHQLTDWHQEVEAVLLALDDCDIECDGMTYAVSHLLTQSGIGHQCLAGYVVNRKTDHRVTPHLWVELDDGWTIDLRLRMWLGDDDTIPHGIFHQAHQGHLEYCGVPIDKNNEVSTAILDLLTDGVISEIELPTSSDKEDRNVRTGY